MLEGELDAHLGYDKHDLRKEENTSRKIKAWSSTVESVIIKLEIIFELE